MIVEDEDDDKTETELTQNLMETMSLAARVAMLTDDERSSFMDEMRSMGEDLGFQDA